MAIYDHRAWDPAGEEYVYWAAPVPLDDTGTFYSGPPAFGTLLGVCVYRIRPDAAELAIIPLKPVTADTLVEYEEVT